MSPSRCFAGHSPFLQYHAADTSLPTVSFLQSTDPHSGHAVGILNFFALLDEDLQTHQIFLVSHPLLFEALQYPNTHIQSLYFFVMKCCTPPQNLQEVLAQVLLGSNGSSASNLTRNRKKFCCNLYCRKLVRIPSWRLCCITEFVPQLSFIYFYNKSVDSIVLVISCFSFHAS